MKTTPLVLSATVLLAAGLSYSLRAQTPAKPVPVTVYKTATCGCCGLWVDHLKANGFAPTVETLDQAKLTTIARQAGVSEEHSSCHTAKVAGYVVEGHVPAADIHKMLKEKPAIVGIAAPGMPIGSPGMDSGPRRDPYDVVAFTKDGKSRVFASHK